jgi:hypothetical protein
MFIPIQSFIYLLRLVEIGIETHSSSNRRRRFGRPHHLPIRWNFISSPLYSWTDSISMFLVVDLIRFVRDRVVGEGKPSDFSSRHQARTLMAGPVTIDRVVPAALPGPPPGQWSTSASHGGRHPGSQISSTGESGYPGESRSQLCSSLVVAMICVRKKRVPPPAAVLLLLALLSCVGTCIAWCWPLLMLLDCLVAMIQLLLLAALLLQFLICIDALLYFSLMWFFIGCWLQWTVICIC